MTAAEYLDAIEARATAATAGPWHWGDGDMCHMAGNTIGPEINHVAAYAESPGDAEFIAHARTDVPALVAALRAVLGVEQDLARWAEANRSFSEDPSAPPHEWIYHDAYAEAGRQLRVAIEAAIGGAS